MPQKRGEVVEKVEASRTVPDVYESWLDKRVKEFSASKLSQQEEEDQEEDEIDKAEDHHEKAHRRKRARGSSN